MPLYLYVSIYIYMLYVCLHIIILQSVDLCKIHRSTDTDWVWVATGYHSICRILALAFSTTNQEGKIIENGLLSCHKWLQSSFNILCFKVLQVTAFKGVLQMATHRGCDEWTIRYRSWTPSPLITRVATHGHFVKALQIFRCRRFEGPLRSDRVIATQVKSPLIAASLNGREIPPLKIPDIAWNHDQLKLT